MSKSKERGIQGEDLIATELEQQGMHIVKRNYRKQFGEIDLIAQCNDLLIFVEVKLRYSARIDLAELINSTKQQRIIMTAKAFCAQYDQLEKICRFDVALIDYSTGVPDITYIPNAFTESD